jgi:hypothetical protein
MRQLFLLAALAVISSGCANMFGLGKDDASADFDRETNANDVQVREDKTRMNLRAIESAIADYVKAENKIPAKLDNLIPKYLAAVPPLDVPACGGENDKVMYYPADALRDGQVDGSRLRGSGRWGYVYNESRVVVFVDCLKPSDKGIPWYQERGVY